ncbi:hypothetical protein ACKC9G_18530 [Pokkaliibacter sp. CJK22405]|uniref:hypothetical protein n=1 Tax=Pokkaliibacter sp. CJK22405 TaxID=3384615 RepID=UPI0039852311
MTEKELGLGGDALSFWSDPLMWICVGMVIIGVFSKYLMSKEVITAKQLLGEVLASGIGAIGIYAAGILRGNSPTEQVVYASLMSLGGLHLIQRTLQAFNKRVIP